MQKMKIDIVSDVMCPWCAIGYKNLEKAMSTLKGELDIDLAWHAFELNPNMPVEGQNMSEHIAEKYGTTAAQSEENRRRITEMGEKSGFKFHFTDNGMMINSFDCHRLLTWAKEHDKQTELKLAMFKAHFTDNKLLNDQDELIAVVKSVGLDVQKAKAILASDEYSQQVREEENRMHQMGITSVPTFIINQKYAISGGQPVEVFEQALKQIQNEQAQV